MGGVRLAALWILWSPRTRRRCHSRAARAGLRGRRAAPPARGGVDRLRPRRRPHRRVRGAGVRELVPGELKTDGQIVGGRLMEPHGVGFALLIAPAYAIGGARAVQWQMLALLAFAFVLAAALARRMVPEPWATVGARWSASPRRRWRPRPRSRPAYPQRRCWRARRCARSRSVSGHDGATFRRRAAARRRCPGWAGRSSPRAVIAWALVNWTLRERRRLAALVAGEALAASLVFYATINDRFYGGLTPRSAGLTSLPELPVGYLERLPRVAGLWLDREPGSCAGRRCSRSCSSPAGSVSIPARPTRPRRPRPTRGRGVRRPAARRRRRAGRGSWPWSPPARCVTIVPGRTAGRAFPASRPCRPGA